MEECEYDNCDSSRFHIGNDGYTYCHEGHQQSQRGTQIAEDNDGQPIFGKRARKQGDTEEDPDDTLTGRRALEHYLLCFQLILWKQTHWLIHVKSLPSELENVVRDLWGLRLQTLQSRASYESESEGEHSSQLYSSQSEAEMADDTSRQRRSRRSKGDAIPQLVDALSLCYIGMLLLRLPITVNDVHLWVASGDLVYYRASKVLSESMKNRLPFNYHQIMDPQSILKPANLHQAVLDNIIAYDRNFGMVVPPLNHVLVLYRWVCHLALPLEVYAAVTRLSKALEVDFSYDVRVKRSSRYFVLRLAEARLMALLVVSTKLLFPMDGVKRYPKKPTELSALTLDWGEWSEARAEYETSVKCCEPMGHEQALQVTEQDVIQMSDQKLDEYMDWYQSTFMDETVREKGRKGKEAEFRRAMFSFFPIDRVTLEPTQSQSNEDSAVQSPKNQRLKRVQGAMRPVRVRQDGMPEKGEDIINRPGSNYKRYRDAKELAGHALEFYEDAAKLSGLSLEMLVKCVFLMERKMQKWEETALNAG